APVVYAAVLDAPVVYAAILDAAVLHTSVVYAAVLDAPVVYACVLDAPVVVRSGSLGLGEHLPVGVTRPGAPPGPGCRWRSPARRPARRYGAPVRPAGCAARAARR